MPPKAGTGHTPLFIKKRMCFLKVPAMNILRHTSV
jgi:hypothetical protein